jgi:hypothetical protein
MAVTGKPTNSSEELTLPDPILSGKSVEALLDSTPDVYYYALH